MGDLRQILAGGQPVRIRREAGAGGCEIYRRGAEHLRERRGGRSRWQIFGDWYRSSLPTYRERPALLPWIRWFLILLEQEIAAAAEDPRFALPYRNWSAVRPDAAAALAQTVYDSPPWDDCSTGLRSRLGVLLPHPDPDDPEFYLALCNIDRLWAAWQSSNPTRPYLPPQSGPESLAPHRRNDRIESPLTPFAPTNGQMLKVCRIYGYDSLTP